MILSRCVLFSLLALLVALSAKAEESATINQFDQAKNELAMEEYRQRRILSALYVANKKMQKVVFKKSKLEFEKSMIENASNDLGTKIRELEEQVGLQRQYLQKRIFAISQLKNKQVFGFMMSARSSSELERNLKIMGLIAKRDVDLIREYHDTVLDLTKQKDKLSRRLTKLAQLKEQIDIQEKLLAKETASKNTILDKIKRAKNKKIIALAKLKSDSGIFDSLFQVSFESQKGKLQPPVQGKIKTPFGVQKIADSPVVMNSKGHFIETKTGSAVKSVYMGRVAFTGDISGFGKTVVIDHGDHFYTVYGNNQAVLVKEGEEIKTSQKIALSGHDETRMGEGLYFEIRHFSEPNDPRIWMKGSSL